MTAEEKRQSHQKELAERINREAKERLAGQKGKTSEKKFVSLTPKFAITLAKSI